MEKYRIPKSPDLTSRHLPSTFGDANIGAILEESQMRFSFPEQGTLDLGLLNAGVSQFTQAAGTSRGVKVWKMENERLRSKIDVMYQSLQAIAGENQILKTQVRCLKREMNQQVVLMDAFSHKQVIGCLV
ncbi:uncharacterized protein LOC119990100 isoform X1 [Tripterygium wilfordii]|uniref:uncharacterized protein LOC119990100 isoform X1 n=1 Tax=Tripterygium wilfordii TaxID=458696 RepID=UPI0018F82DA2|nr:uncharacterized protein LOC119990100 isoform X1 [Tripterygium wilfordii]